MNAVFVDAIFVLNIGFPKITTAQIFQLEPPWNGKLKKNQLKKREGRQRANYTLLKSPEKNLNQKEK